MHPLFCREDVKEDEAGSIRLSVADVLRRQKRELAARKGNVRLGIMRHVFIVVDMSEAACNNVEFVLLGRTTGLKVFHSFPLFGH
ncbi:unnamed protein product [Soboliphyme baturini]|uniref:Uncharacterized protein n=1 Tax=Soboliphyme baturini TaxID=241478 RepID=A0A183IA36_9BILA|nr:unnamed protein product [Soboliphyme baturini]